MEQGIKIDGGYGEGGGQILRSALALSSLTKRPMEVHNIRKGRKNPGLQPQHLTSVLAAQKIASADISGAALGSQHLRFLPKGIQGGNYSFDVSEKKGSAGSVTLVLQTILLPLSLAIRGSTIGIIGGTHVPWSPSFQYLDHIFLPVAKRIGLDIRLTLERWGFYPKGGGKVEAEVLPAGSFSAIDIKERGDLKRIWGVSATSNLPRSIAERQRDQAVTILKGRGFAPQIDIVEAPSIGQGTFLILITEFENSIAGFSSLGARGKRAEKVGEEAATAFLDFYQSGAALDPYLADQLLPYLAIAKGESIITTSRISRHLLTNIWVIEQFLPVKFIVEGKEGEPGKITVSG
ncbi:MAG: RNA 3'-phosphate cyclase [Nitrospirae bacterium]|nr:RNA 3'-phosphate cyclase [Nitrospirota bacterium]